MYAALLWQRGQGLLNHVEEPLRVGFVRGGATLEVLEVALGGLGIGPGAQQQIALLRRGFCLLSSIHIHEGQVVARLPSAVAVTGLLTNLHVLLIVLTGTLGLADSVVKNAQIVVDRPQVGNGGGGAEGQRLLVVRFRGLGVLAQRCRWRAALKRS